MVTCFRSLTATISASSRLNVSRNRIDELKAEYNLNGKTIYPFSTHEGSGLGNCVSDLRKAYSNADVKKGFSIYGHEVRTNKAKVENWIKGLEL